MFRLLRQDVRVCAHQWRGQNEAEDAIAPPEKTRKLLLVLFINLQQLENKRKEQSDSRQGQRLTTSLTGLSRTKFLAALLTCTLSIFTLSDW